MRHTACVSSFLGNRYMNLFLYKETHFFGFIQFSSLLAQLCYLVAHPVGVAPGNKQSGGKRLKAHTNKGNTHLRAVLAEVVWVISHTRDNYLSAQYHRLAHRLGKKRAIVAVSHSLVTIIYHMLQENEDYHELGFHYFQTLDTTRQRDTAVRRLQALGYKVSLEEITEVRA